MNIPIDQPVPIRPGEELELDRLEAFLVEHLPPVGGRFRGGQLTVAQFPSGFSNLTYLLTMGEDEYVLRRPPLGNVVESAHDMGREYRVLSKLSPNYPPAPRPVLFCEDEKIVGSTFYIMHRCRGVILRKTNIPEELMTSPELTHALCESFVNGMVQLHQVDYQAIGLGELGRPHGYVNRQVIGWSKRYASAKTNEYPEIEKLATWLSNNMPADSSPALIHNDYKYDNLVLDPQKMTNIVGVLDWEMTTIGDPLMDLGMTLAYWVEPNDSEEEKARAFGPTMLTGSMSRQQLVERYAQLADIRLPETVFYYGFGLFKLAVIVQQIYARFAAGKTRDKRFANLNKMVESLVKPA